MAHPSRAPSLARFSFACSISTPPEKGKESAATQPNPNIEVVIPFTDYHTVYVNRSAECQGQKSEQKHAANKPFPSINYDLTPQIFQPTGTHLSLGRADRETRENRASGR